MSSLSFSTTSSSSPLISNDIARQLGGGVPGEGQLDIKNMDVVQIEQESSLCVGQSTTALETDEDRGVLALPSNN
jgi:hypothetical protein